MVAPVFVVFAFTLTVVMALTFTAFVATGGLLIPRSVFTVLSLVFAMRVQAVAHFREGVFALSEGRVAVDRRCVDRLQVGHVTIM